MFYRATLSVKRSTLNSKKTIRSVKIWAVIFYFYEDFLYENCQLNLPKLLNKNFRYVIIELRKMILKVGRWQNGDR